MERSETEPKMRAASNLEVVGEWLFRWRGPASGAVLLGVVAATYAVAATSLGGTIPGPVADVAGLALIALATGLRAHVAATAPPGTSGRNRTRQLATSLNTTGLYSLVRHPLYFANLMAWAGVGILSGSWWVAGGTLVVGLAFYGPIIVAEDAFLGRSFGEAHRGWVARTPSLIPRLRGWRPSATRIQWRTLLRREYPSTVVIATAVYLIHTARTIEWSNPGSVSVAWTTAFGLVLAGAFCLRLISHRTDLLEAAPPEQASDAPQADSARGPTGRRRP